MKASIGLGLRRSLCQPLIEHFQSGATAAPDFFELAPENWMDVGGRFGAALDRLAAERPIIAHGLSLSLGGTDPLDRTHLSAIRQFLDRYQAPIYSEHLSSSAIDGHLYDLGPIPFTETMLRYLADRIRQTQDILGRRIAVENSSYYLKLAGENGLSESQFINALVTEADCDLLLDVNNVYVNSRNHSYDPYQFIAALDPKRVRYFHVAGHDDSEVIIVDTHGADVPDPVWQLLAHTIQTIGARPTLIERDFNMPPLPQLLAEVQRASAVMAAAAAA